MIINLITHMSIWNNVVSLGKIFSREGRHNESIFLIPYMSFDLFKIHLRAFPCFEGTMKSAPPVSPALIQSEVSEVELI